MPHFAHHGHRLFYREQGEGTLLMILPGNTASSACYEGELNYFSRRYRAVSLDFAGTGASDWLETLERRAIAAASWRDFGAVIVVRDLDEAAALSNRVAPEHLELCVADPDALATKITHAGAIFLGGWTPEAIGDYVGGPNHVLPTARSARFSSGLSVMDFLKRTTIARMTPEALAAIGPAAERLAISESLQAHGLSVRARLDRLNGGQR